MKDEKEFFIDIPKYEGLYQISNLGNVLSLNYARKGYPNKLKKRIDTMGYYSVSLYRINENLKREKKQFRICKLMGLSFYGYNTEINCIHHIDNNTLNDNLENLQISTTRENVCFSKYDTVCMKRGVTKHGKKFRSRIDFFGNRIHLGCFDTINEANDIYMYAWELIEELKLKYKL